MNRRSAPARQRTGAYRFWHTHVRALLTTVRVADGEAMTDVLLGPLAPEVYQHMRDDGPDGPARAQITAVRRLATLLS